MAKTSEGSAVTKPATSNKPAKAARARSAFGEFVGNLLRATIYKPTQGQRMRWATGLGLGAIVGTGVFLLSERLNETAGAATRLWVPAAVAGGLGWLIFRLMHFPPFAEFLIATEAEMNKVSWISKHDLKRAAQVVLATVVLLSFYLFAIDGLWFAFLKLIGIIGTGVSMDVSPNS